MGRVAVTLPFWESRCLKDTMIGAGRGNRRRFADGEVAWAGLHRKGESVGLDLGGYRPGKQPLELKAKQACLGAKKRNQWSVQKGRARQKKQGSRGSMEEIRSKT